MVLHWVLKTRMVKDDTVGRGSLCFLYRHRLSKYVKGKNFTKNIYGWEKAHKKAAQHQYSLGESKLKNIGIPEHRS